MISTVAFTGNDILNLASGKGDETYHMFHILILSDNLTNFLDQKSIFIAFYNTPYRCQNTTILDVTFEKKYINFLAVYFFVFLFIFSGSNKLIYIFYNFMTFKKYISNIPFLDRHFLHIYLQ